MIKKIIELQNSPEELSQYYSERVKSPRIVKLGFGYWIKSIRIGSGYIGIRTEFYYFKDSILSHVIYPELPRKRRKYKKYIEWYDDNFEISNGSKLVPKYFNYDVFYEPLSEYSGPVSYDAEIRNYMSPASGVNYGIRGGATLILLTNRRNFLELQDKLSSELVIQLMYSKNPATRLTAIEYYYRNPGLFERSKERIDNWTERVFMSPYLIHTIRGCFGGYEKARELTKEYSEVSLN